MGKNKRGGGSSKKSKAKKSQVHYSADDLMDKVDEYIDRFEYDLALKFCEKAISVAPTNLRVVETAASVFAEIGDTEKSKLYFTKAVEINADTGHEKYMYLGQMSTGLEAQKWYLKGIEIMKNELTAANSADNSSTEGASVPSRFIDKGPLSANDISNAFCALAEIFMTDCCFEENAEKQCETYCREALESDPNNVDAYIVNANFLLSTEKNNAAKELLGNCFSLLKLKEPKPDDIESIEDNEKMTEVAEASGGEAGLNDDGEESNDTLPSYASRVTLAKLLTEVQEYGKSELLLGGLIEEDDEDIETWYMLGWNLFLDEHFSDAVFYLEKAAELCEKFECNDQELVKHIQEMLDKCTNQSNGCEDGMEMEE